jgi:hypothetical protein
LPRQRLLQKAWTQEQLGCWHQDLLSAEVLVIGSRWRQRLSHRSNAELQPAARVLELPCRP